MKPRAGTRKKGRRTSSGGLPAMLSRARALRALTALGISEAEFLRAYSKAAAPRGRGVAKPVPEVISAYRSFQKNGDFEAFVRDGGFSDRARATHALGRCARYLARHER